MLYQPNEEPLFCIDNLSLALSIPHRKQILSSITFAVHAGEAVGLIGGSGSGKSMIVRSILDLLPRYAIRTGRIQFEGCVLQKDRQVIGKKIGTVFQDPMTALNPLFRIATQLLESLRLHRNVHGIAAWDAAHALLETVEMPDPHRCLQSYPYELSGGMRQRVCIAIALAGNPQLLIADEPTTALDVTTQHEIVTLLERLRSQHHLAILWISHDLPLVAQLCSRLLVLYEGKLIETGPTKSVFTTPSHPYTRALLAAIPSHPAIGSLG